MASTAATSTTAQPTRATWKGHGNPNVGILFGFADKPASGDGVPVTITTAAGGTAVVLSDMSGKEVCSFGVASKFWLAPALQRTAEAAPAKATKATTRRGPAKTGDPQADREANAAKLAKAAPKAAKAPARKATAEQEGPARGELRRTASAAAKTRDAGTAKLTGRYAVGDTTEDGWEVRWVNQYRLLLARTNDAGTLVWCARMVDGTDLPAATGKDAYELAGAYAVRFGLGQVRTDSPKWAARMAELDELLAAAKPAKKATKAAGRTGKAVTTRRVR